LRGRPLEVAELVLAPAAGKTAQAVGDRAPRAETLAEQVDDRLVQRFTATAFLFFQCLGEVRRQIPDRQCFDDLRSSAFKSCIY
jgi:hypothetical protein